MRNFWNVFAFTFKSQVKNKTYMVLTVGLVLVVAVLLSWPRISSMFSKEGSSDDSKIQTIAIVGGEAEFFNEGFTGTKFKFENADITKEAATLAVESGQYSQIIFIDSPLLYTRITQNVALNDIFKIQFESLLKSKYQFEELTKLGASPEIATGILAAEIKSNVELASGGKDQAQQFWNVYIVLLALYFAIMMYGQIIASSVADEKSSRAMEILITATDTKTLMFGKVLGTAASGLLQLCVILGGIFVSYRANIAYHAADSIIGSMFNMSASILAYTIIFFLLGFLIYAFMYAAFASLVSRLEELNSTIMPATLIFMFSFVYVMMSMASGNIDSTLMTVCSFIPLTSPLAMFARIALTTVPIWQIALSIGILGVSVVGMGYLATFIYRVGVLMYGVPPTPKELFKQLKAVK